MCAVDRRVIFKFFTGLFSSSARNGCRRAGIIKKKNVQVNIWKIIYLNCGERYEDMIDHRPFNNDHKPTHSEKKWVKKIEGKQGNILPNGRPKTLKDKRQEKKELSL